MKGQERTKLSPPAPRRPGISRPNFVLLAAAAGLILDQQDAGVAVALLGLGRLLVRVVVPPLGAADRGRRAVASQALKLIEKCRESLPVLLGGAQAERRIPPGRRD